MSHPTALERLGASAKRSYEWAKENGNRNGDAYVLACQVEEFAKEIDRLNAKLDRLDREIPKMLDREYDTGMREGVLADRRERSRG